MAKAEQITRAVGRDPASARIVPGLTISSS